MFCDLYVDRVQNTTARRTVNNTKTNYTIANVMLEGVHNWSVQCNDSVRLQNISGLHNFTIDATSPKVVDVRNITEGLNTSDTTPEFVWAVNDSLSDVMYCDLYVDRVQNATGIYATNNTATNYTIANVMTEGAHNWSVQCNDSVNLQNVSGLHNFTIDTTSPT